MKSPEPRFSRIAAAISDPTRARMLAVLLAGEARSASELARAAGVSAQAASTQLAQLVDAGLLAVRTQGRYKYFSLADADVAHALEALSLLAERDAVGARWDTAGYAPLKYARRCYGHLAGELGVALIRTLVSKGVITSNGRGAFAVTESGRTWLTQLGLDPNALKPTVRLAYPCMDWSERKDHLAGTLAKAMLTHFLEQRWLTLQTQSRALTLTSQGVRAFGEHGIRL